VDRGGYWIEQSGHADFKQSGLCARLVNGRTVKSINQFYNKRRAEWYSQWGEAHTSRRLERLTTRRTRRIDW